MSETVNLRWKRVAWSMLAGALYDAGFASAIWVFPQTASRWLALSLPQDRVYFELNGIFLLIIAATYLLAVFNPRRYQAIVVIAVGGRFLGFLHLGHAWLEGRPIAFGVLALADLGFSLIHALLLWAAGVRSRPVQEFQGS